MGYVGGPGPGPGCHCHRPITQPFGSHFPRLPNGEVWLDSKESIPKDSYSKDPVSSDSMSVCSPCQLR